MTNKEAIDVIKCLAWHTRPNEEDIEQAIRALEQEPCGDCISREAVLDVVNFEDEWLFDAKSHNADTKIAFSAIKSKISEIPSVTPQPKMGEWLKNGELCKCSNCHSNVLFSAIKHYNFCPNCGASMEVEYKWR